MQGFRTKILASAGSVVIALVMADAALAADYVCPIEPEPLPHLAWTAPEQASADELFTRAREGFRFWSYDADFRRAIYDSLQELTRRAPQDPRAYVELARFAMIEGFVDQLALSEDAYDFADRMLSRALELDAGYAPAWALSGLFRLHRRGANTLTGDSGIVEAALAESERLDPDSSDVAFAWASYYSLRSRFDLAIGEMQRLLQQQDLSRKVAAAAYRRLGAYYRDSGEPQQALAATEDAIALDGYDPRNLLLYSSLALEEQADPGLALTAARLAFCLDPSVATNQRLAYALYASWAVDNVDAADPVIDDDRLTEAVARYANIADVVGYLSETERLSVLTHVLIRAGIGADIKDPQDGSTALLDAASRGLIEEVKALIALGADVNVADANQQRLLTVAVRRRDLPMVRLALAHGAEIDARSHERTALMLAVMARDEAIVRALVDAGADVNLADGDGNTSLSLATGRAGARPMVAIVDLLLEAGASPR